MKKQNNEELIKIAAKLRADIYNHISSTEGHLGSNLSIIELTVSLLNNFDPKSHRYIFDTGYQSYAYKILNDRPDFLEKLKNHEYSIFQEISESNLDHFSGGHTSISTSWAAGYNNINDGKKVIEIIGDGSLATSIGLGGMLNFPNKDKKGLFILNDNKEGIGLNKFNYLNWELISKGMGFDYFEVKDGHDFDELQKAWDFFNDSKKSVFVKVNTTKSKGYESKIVDKNESLHYIVKNKPQIEMINSNSFIIEHLNEVLAENKNSLIFSPGMMWALKLKDLDNNVQNQIIDSGISEEVSLVSAAAAANAGKDVYLLIRNTFFQRCYDQLVHDIMRNNLKLKIIIFGTGITHLGDSHHNLYDLNMYNSFTNIHVYSPSNTSDVVNVLQKIDQYNGTSIVRLPEFIEEINEQENNSEIWNWEVKSNSKNILLTYGDSFLRFKDYFNKNNVSNINLIEAKSINPIDIKMIQKIIDEKYNLFVYENVFWKNNLSTTIFELYGNKLSITPFSYRNEIIGRGNTDQIEINNSMDPENIIKLILKK